MTIDSRLRLSPTNYSGLLILSFAAAVALGQTGDIGSTVLDPKKGLRFTPVNAKLAAGQAIT